MRSFVLALSLIASAAAHGVMVRDKAPDFTAMAVEGDQFKQVSLSSYSKAGKWVVLFFYPFDFTFVCPTEILTFSEKAAEFASKNTQVLGVSCDSHHVHLAWTKTPQKDGGLGNSVNYPLVADIQKTISESYGVLTHDESVGYVGAPLRATFIIDPSGTIRSMSVNDEQVGRNIDEVMRLLDGFQYADSHQGEGCPANWNPGKMTIKANPTESKDFFEAMAGKYGKD